MFKFMFTIRNSLNLNYNWMMHILTIIPYIGLISKCLFLFFIIPLLVIYVNYIEIVLQWEKQSTEEEKKII